MMKINKKQIKIMSIIIGIAFIGSIIALGLTQNLGVAGAASSGSVGVIDARQVMSQHPELSKTEEAMQKEIEQVRKSFEEKSAGMSEQEKQEYYMQSQELLRQKNQEIYEPLEQSIKDAVKKVAEAKGLSVVVTKDIVIYGGVEITQEVINRIAKGK